MTALLTRTKRQPRSGPRSIFGSNARSSGPRSRSAGERSSNRSTRLTPMKTAKHRIHKMSTDTTTLSTPAVSDLVSRVAAHLQRFPKSQRAGVLQTISRNLHKREAMELKYAWSLHARDSQLPPDGDWDTWLILAGRGFGKTRTGAEWVRAQSLPRTPIQGRSP